MAQENDPLAKYRIASDSDPLAKYRAPLPETPKDDPLSKYRPEVQEEEGTLSKIWNFATTSLLPESQNREYTPETLPPFANRVIDEVGRGFYEDIVRPTASPLGAALTVFGGPIARGAFKYATKIPGVTKVADFLTKERSLFGKVSEEVITPKVSPPVVTPTETPTQPMVTNTWDNVTGKPNVKPRVKYNLDGTYSPIDNPTIKLDSTGAPLPGPIDKLLTALDEAKPLTAEQAKIYSRERAIKASAADTVETTGQKGFWERKGKLAGEHSKVQMEPVKLDQNDVDSLFDDIEVAGLERFQKINASTGLEKILNGQVPQQSEIALLQKVFGEDKVSALASKLPKVDKRGSWLNEAINLPRAIQASYDLSFPFRQGLTSVHTAGWWKAWPDMIRSYGSEKAYRGVLDSILKRPNYKTIIKADGTRETPFFQQAGLKLTDLTDLTSREEELMSSVAEKILPGVRASNRAYTAFANKLRADNFDKLISSAEQAGLNPRGNLDLAQKIATYVNNASGRGNLGALESSAVGLNALLFSPRFIASRLAMMNPKNYLRLANAEDRFVSKQYAKSLIALSGAWLGQAALADYAGAEVGTDPNSTDFGKIKIGETRLDPGAGFQQYIVLASRLANGEYSTSTGNERAYGGGFGSKRKYDAMIDFITNKLAPLPSFAARAAGASEYRPFNVIDESAKLFAPMLAQDISEILQEDPSLLPLSIPAAVGYGVDVQGERGDKTLIPGFGDQIQLTGSEGIDDFFGRETTQVRRRR